MRIFLWRTYWRQFKWRRWCRLSLWWCRRWRHFKTSILLFQVIQIITPPDSVTPIVHPSHKMNNMDPSPSKSVSIETSNGGKKETIIFPRLEKMGNSIIIINSTTGDAELDTLDTFRSTMLSRIRTIIA